MKGLKLSLYAVLSIAFVFFAFSALAQERAPRKSGGPCGYKTFKGDCKIASIEKTFNSKRQAKINGGPGYEGYEVTFTFTPEKPLDFSNVPWAKGMEREILNTQYPLLLTSSWYPSAQFLRRYNIEKDAVFACEMDLITSGTCTPVIFKFSGIDLSDYLQ